MTRNSHGRKSRTTRSLDNDPGRPIRDVRRAYKRIHHGEEWEHDFGDAGVEELEDFDALSDIEESELDALEEFIEPEEEEHG